MKITRLAEVEWTFGDEEDPNWKWCMNNANFVHREACEFILHIGDDDPPYWEFMVKEMREGGCTEGFVLAYLAAKDDGALRVLFHG